MVSRRNRSACRVLYKLHLLPRPHDCTCIGLLYIHDLVFTEKREKNNTVNKKKIKKNRYLITFYVPAVAEHALGWWYLFDEGVTKKWLKKTKKNKKTIELNVPRATRIGASLTTISRFKVIVVYASATVVCPVCCTICAHDSGAMGTGTNVLSADAVRGRSAGLSLVVTHRAGGYASFTRFPN